MGVALDEMDYIWGDEWRDHYELALFSPCLENGQVIWRFKEWHTENSNFEEWECLGLVF